MRNEEFIEILKRQYVQRLKGAYDHCSINAGSTVDTNRLGQLIQEIKNGALFDGITHREFEHILEGTLPGLFEDESKAA